MPVDPKRTKPKQMEMTRQNENISVLNGFPHHESKVDGSSNPQTRVKAVNLGGWLVTEGWIKPSLFDGIPNKDLLDGTRLQFKSIANGKYLSIENGGGGAICVDAMDAPAGETFRLWRITERLFHFRVSNKKFVGLDSTDVATLVARSDLAGKSETFEIVRCPDDPMLVRIKAPNGSFLQVRKDELVMADCEHETVGWGEGDPSVFSINITKRLEGEFQVTNGYGPEKAEQVMREHWSTYIVEEDFKFVSENGLDAVRIPVGWWIASEPPPPYVGGSLVALDNAFSWAQKHKLKVIIDLHAAPGSQNGWEHSSSRDGFQEWAANDSDIQQTVAVIEFLAARYADSPRLYAIQLLNEPLAPIVSLENIEKFYKAGFEAVRRHTSTAYVIFSTVLGTGPEDLLPLASCLDRTVIDVHYYNLFRTTFDTIEENMDCIYSKRSAHLSSFTKEGGHPLTFIGEWVAEWKVKEATEDDLKRFAEAQLEVYGRATFGWAYWTLKNVNNHWSLEWMIKNGFITI